MCKKIVGSLSESDLESECRIDNTQQHQIHHRERFLMDSSNEDNPRVKFLCSFSGSILPRPQDGKLRYVGGETRIVSVARDISYEELMVKMREIFEGVEVLKYQQPDEDLDALVSVVNDDDVTNMMEEYDKLGEGGGFSKLRVFLVSQSDQECSFADVDERDNEIWYFDALNGFNESPEFRRQQNGDFHRVVSFEDVHLAEQFYNQRNFEVPAHVDLRHLRIPHHNDLEFPWSPSYYEAHDPRGFKEFPTSPSTGRFRTPYSEFSDQGFGRMPEEYNAHQVNNVYEHPIQYTDNLARVANPSYVYGADKVYHVRDRHVPSQTMWRNIHSPLAGSPPMANGSFSPRLRHGMGSPQKIFGFDGGLSRATSASLLNNLVDTTSETESRFVNNVTSRLRDEIVLRGDQEITQQDKLDGANSVENNIRTARLESDILDDGLNFLPELMASVREAKLENVKEVRAKLEEGIESDIEHVQSEPDQKEMNPDLEIDSENNYRIEPTEAEEEAIKRGLQTIRNEDLEEIRELGSGTFGSVFYGKWKGSDVAIKRIKARCFAGKPSERQRLITDFWKEALMLSSLHHPNVVSFFGVVRDGPDGSLATITEFMVNGSLKQFLRKKDRTIDRRKRLLIAMDAAFGMEYLHGKNIVHFDLKCENLLVNMRDPHRPVCKIGDLGLSKVKQSTLVSGGVRGTLPWMAPELLSGKTTMVTEKIDVYSFGIVMWELLTGDEPYSDMHCASVIGGIVNDSLRPEIPTWCDPEWKSLMESSWASDPGKRPSFCEISQKLRTMAAAMNLK